MLIPSRKLARRGFTLVELAVAVALSSLLTVALGAALSVALRAVPKAGATTSEQTAARALARLAADVACMDSVTVFTSQKIEGTVRDRDGDGRAESIQWRWNGVVGSPLERVYGSDNPETVLPAVQECSFAYSAISTALTVTASVVAGNETALFSGGTGGADRALIGTTLSVGEAVVPALPSGASGWSLTRVVVPLASSGSADGVLRIVIQRITAGGLPDGSTLAQFDVAESSLSTTPAGIEFAPASPIAFSSGQGVAVLVTHISGSVSGQVTYWAGARTGVGASMLRSVDGGLSWAADAAASLNVQLYGTISVSSGATRTRAFLESVRARLRSGAAGASAAELTIRALNTPELQP